MTPPLTARWKKQYRIQKDNNDEMNILKEGEKKKRYRKIKSYKKKKK